MNKHLSILLSVIICFCITASLNVFRANAVTGFDSLSKILGARASAPDYEQSSFAYKKYSTISEYSNVLRVRMRDVFNNLSGHLDESSIVPVPGVIETCTRYDSESSSSDSYVPQGLCKAGRYWLVTAYDSTGENNSVVYVIDSEKQRLESTLTLPNKYHAGGIAFDGDNIWLTGNTSDKYKGEPFVQYITYVDFVGMIKDSLHEVGKSELSERIYIKNRPSFLECDNGKLWVGTYIGTKGTKDAYMIGYSINKEGEETTLNTVLCSMISGIDSSAQGADIYGDYLYVSSSYKSHSSRIKSSFITKYEISPLKKGRNSLYVEDREVSRVEVPKMNEEILVDNNNIYINFESAAKKWKWSVIVTDRILAVNKSLWDN